ncbi:MAG: hypothetical protein H6807_09925 [Planctomycetes bacterium]|nr:hypothetical protein [Planctomycetota bacterium]
MEALRRVLVVVLVIAGVWAFFLADLSPLVSVRPETRPPRGNERIVPVSGPDWRVFLATVDEAAFGRGPEAWRAGPEQDYMSSVARKLFYRPDEGPFAGIVPDLERPYGFVLLELDGRRYVLQRITLADDDFQFGSGYASIAPPDRFFRPWRRWSPWLLGAALLAYLILPWPRREAGLIAHARWRVVMSDLLSLLLFLPFFALPFFIIGGSVQTFTVGWPLLIGLWTIAALGLWAFWLAAWSSGFALRIEEDGLGLRSFGSWRRFAWSEMESFGPAVRRSPGWMRALGVLAALSGRSGGAATMLATSSSYGGLAIRLRDQHTLLLWICTPLGAPTLDGAEELPIALRRAGIAEFEEPLIHEGFGRGLLVPSRRLIDSAGTRAGSED